MVKKKTTTVDFILRLLQGVAYAYYSNYPDTCSNSSRFSFELWLYIQENTWDLQRCCGLLPTMKYGIIRGNCKSLIEMRVDMCTLALATPLAARKCGFEPLP